VTVSTSTVFGVRNITVDNVNSPVVWRVVKVHTRDFITDSTIAVAKYAKHWHCGLTIETVLDMLGKKEL